MVQADWFRGFSFKLALISIVYTIYLSSSNRISFPYFLFIFCLLIFTHSMPSRYTHNVNKKVIISRIECNWTIRNEWIELREIIERFRTDILRWNALREWNRGVLAESKFNSILLWFSADNVRIGLTFLATVFRCIPRQLVQIMRITLTVLSNYMRLIRSIWIEDSIPTTNAIHCEWWYLNYSHRKIPAFQFRARTLSEHRTGILAMVFICKRNRENLWKFHSQKHWQTEFTGYRLCDGNWLLIG